MQFLDLMIGKKYHINTIFAGSFDISEIKPKIHFSKDLSSIIASAIVKILLALKHWDTQTGATLWTDSRYGKWSLANVNKETGRPVSFNLNFPEDKYGDYLVQLINGSTEDFRPHFEKRVVTNK